ncbi:hypothetical protein EMPG_11030, partial [Blastomyces silverae]
MGLAVLSDPSRGATLNFFPWRMATLPLFLQTLSLAKRRSLDDPETRVQEFEVSSTLLGCEHAFDQRWHIGTGLA